MAHTIKKTEPEHVRDITPHYEEVELDVQKKCDHSFDYTSSDSIKCSKCHFGLFIGLGDHIKDGHLYNYNKLII